MENQILEVSGDNVIYDDLFKDIEIQRDSLLYYVKRGLQGFNSGIKCEMPELNTYLHGVQRGEYYLVGSESGAGKTTFADLYFVFSVYYYCKEHNIPFTLLYYSFEISKMAKKAKFASYVLYKRHGVRIAIFKILGKDESNKLSREELELVINVHDEVEEFFRNIIFIDEPTNPTGIYKELFKELENVGVFHKEEYLDSDNNKRQKIIGYEYSNPQHMFMCMIDHIALATIERGFSLKENMDKISEYMVYFRNRCNITPVVVQQFNTDLASTHRKNQTEDSIAPTRLDFGDSKYTFRDANVVICPVDPVIYDISKMDKYNLRLMNDKYRALYLIKNRDGGSNVRNHLLMDPITNNFVELRKTDITTDYLKTVYETAELL